MRVLFPIDYDEHPYVSGLCDSLKKQGLKVDTRVDKFWMNSKGYNIVHLQWPESLFAWRKPLWSEVRLLLETVIPKWRRSGKVVITRHNAKRHDIGDKCPSMDYLYEHITDLVDGIVHLGEYETRKFGRQQKASGCRHVVIPHPVFTSYNDPIDRHEARRLLGISTHKTVILVFGSIRNFRERSISQRAFFKANIRNKILIAPSFGNAVRPSRRRLISWLCWEYKNHEILWPRRMHLSNVRVPDEMVHVYLSAANVVLIPRIDTLNSGILPLSFQFGKVVVGPNIGNIGPVLKRFGNPVFDPSSAESCAAALEKGVNLDSHDLGAKNLAATNEIWSMDRIACLHKRYYLKLITPV